MKNIITKFIRISIYLILLSSIVLLGLYVFSKKTFYVSVNTVAYVGAHVLPTSGYETKYGIHPILDKKLRIIIKEANSKGIDLRVIEGYRSLEKQKYYFSKGRIIDGNIVTNALPGLSLHNYGWAVDVCPYKNGKPYWKSSRWKEIGAMAKKQGLIWGGDWKRLKDVPHLQLKRSDIYNAIW